MIQPHGGNIYGYGDVLDFSANINPLGAPASVKRAIAASAADAERYPDPYCSELREKIAAREGVRAENIVCGNGADDLIFRAVRALKPRKALVCAPTFTEYRRALSEVGCEIVEYPLSESCGFELGEDFAGALGASFDACFVCSPNNPTGRLVRPEILRAISARCRELGAFLFCDECFMDFVSDGEKYSLKNFPGENSVVLKAFTKIYAIPGIRLGYAICGGASIAEKIRENGQFWSVSSVAQAAGAAALGEEDYVRKTAELVAGERAFLSAELSDLGFRVFPSAANFLLFKGSAGLCEKALAEGMLIRGCANFSGLSDEFYRIAVRSRSENERLIAALGRCVNG